MNPAIDTIGLSNTGRSPYSYIARESTHGITFD
jgi:hypothetical protein